MCVTHGIIQHTALAALSELPNGLPGRASFSDAFAWKRCVRRSAFCAKVTRNRCAIWIPALLQGVRMLLAATRDERACAPLRRRASSGGNWQPGCPQPSCRGAAWLPAQGHPFTQRPVLRIIAEVAAPAILRSSNGGNRARGRVKEWDCKTDVDPSKDFLSAIISIRKALSATPGELLIETPRCIPRLRACGTSNAV